MFPVLNRILKRIREQYDNLWLSEEDINITFADFISKVDTAQKHHLNQEIFIPDVNRRSAEYIYALNSLLQTADSEIIFFTDRLEGAAPDEQSSNILASNILAFVMQFLRKMNTNIVKIVTRYPMTSNLLERQPLVHELLTMNGFRLYCAGSNRVRKCESTCVIVDRKAYSFRVKRFSWLNFNDSEFATKLSLSIEKAIRLPDTCLFDDKSIESLKKAYCMQPN